MSHILICAHSNPGHVTPVLAVGAYLAMRGHTITFHTAEAFRQKAEDAGLRFVATTGKADIDYREPIALEEIENHTALGRTLGTVKKTIAEALPDLDRDLQRILEESSVDLILTSSMYFGAIPLLLRSEETRPPVIACGVNPLMLNSVDCGPLSPPDATSEGYQRIREVNLEIERDWAPFQEALNDALQKCFVPGLSEFWMNAIYRLPDLVLQFSGEAFEFPRNDSPSHLHFVGPVLSTVADVFEEPAWWSELDGSKPVILVTQGTLANGNLDELIQPALIALANEDVIVIAATGRPENGELLVPANARVESFVSFLHLLPKVDVMVTNGGFGAVQQCLSFGVPLVICGESEDKAFTAMRVEWSGAGINVKTGSPSAEQIRAAVQASLTTMSYKQQARRLQKDIARYNSLETISQYVDSMLSHKS